MIRLKFQAISFFEDTISERQFDVPINKPMLLLGRGDELQDKNNASCETLNLQDLSRSISRQQASFYFSPEWFTKRDPSVARYLTELGNGWERVTNDALYLIWQFVRPVKRCFLRDSRSKLGLFRKVQDAKLRERQIINFGGSQDMMTLHEQIYNSQEEMTRRMRGMESQGYEVIRKENQLGKKHTFLCVKFKHQSYLLVASHHSRLTIGRSRACDITLQCNAISRCHATLICQDYEWRITDGNGDERSVNGLWKKVEKVQRREWEGEKLRIGDLLMRVEVLEDPCFFNFQGLFREKQVEEQQEYPLES